MRYKTGIVLILVGLLLIGSAAGLYLHNRDIAMEAAESVLQVTPEVLEAIENCEKAPEPNLPQFIANREPDSNREMPTVNVGGHDYIGCLTIPSLGLELPIMSSWNYPKLRIAPCRYTGSLYLDNLVLMAHNYDRHFGRIKDLRSGDRITFTDMEGTTVEYEVIALEILSPTAIEEMTAGEFDLTLFTCTYGGKSRVTVRCDRIEEPKIR